MAGVVLLAMNGAFSRVVLESLLADGVDLGAVVTPGPGPRTLRPPRRRLRVSPPTPAQVAWDHGLPVIEVGRPEGIGPPGILRELAPSALAVACFPWILPRSWLELCPGGGLNVHPSLLPAYRGPAPLFWQLRAGESRTGVTVHRLEAVPDAGDIVGQAEVPFEDGLTRDELETRLAEAGARLLADALRSPGPGRSQPAAAASHQGFPGPYDLEVPTSWSARRAYNFIVGAADWGPFTITGGGIRFEARGASSFSPRGGQPGSVRRTGLGHEVGFSPGTVLVT